MPHSTRLVVPELLGQIELEQLLVALVSVIDKLKSNNSNKNFLLPLRRVAIRILMKIWATNCFSNYFSINTDIINNSDNPFDFIEK